MASSSVPPEAQPKVKPFDPLVLDRALIAVPLLDQIEDEIEQIKKVQKIRPDFLKDYNTVIELNPKYPGWQRSEKEKQEQKPLGRETQAPEEQFKPGVQGAWAHTLQLTKESHKKGRAAFQRKLDRMREEDAGEADPTGERQRRLEIEKNRRANWVKAAEELKIDRPYRKTPYSFAVLHAAMVQRIVTANEQVSDDPDQRPIRAILPTRIEVIIDLNLEHPGGREAAREWVIANVPEVKKAVTPPVEDEGQEVLVEKSRLSKQYLFARLEARAIQALVDRDMADAFRAAKELRDLTHDPKLRAQIDPARYRAIYHIWPDFEMSATINKSIATVKADAAQISFSARGAGIVWAVADSGIDNSHQHFTKHSNIDPKSKWHRDFTDSGDPFLDENGHGSHVAGIIAGEWQVAPNAQENERPLAVSRYRKANSKDIEYQKVRLERISGMAPECRLVSLKVLNENGKGAASSLIAAITHVQEINGYGRRLLIHGVNLSLGYGFEPEWFACGQSPLCVEVDRLVKSGVVVVVAAGNTGYRTVPSGSGTSAAGMALTINDPGNADLAITVGATHRDMPHMYGVSYFSSKGPTGDGRLKPDVVAPGEKIISCATGKLRREGAPDLEPIEGGTPRSPFEMCQYVETSGTSMAAPHVSGAIAAFLSVRTEFIGKPERVKEIFLSTATSLRRDPYFQGAGLVDLMRAIQSI